MGDTAGVKAGLQQIISLAFFLEAWDQRASKASQSIYLLKQCNRHPIIYVLLPFVEFLLKAYWRCSVILAFPAPLSLVSEEP